MGVLRYTPSNSPEKLEPFEEYALVDGLEFTKCGLFFPATPPPVTYLEYIFLLEGYKVHYEELHGSVYSPAFDAGIQELNKMDGSNVGR